MFLSNLRTKTFRGVKAAVLAVKDYHRCAHNRERGTCANATMVRAAIVEETALSALPSRLLAPNLIKLSIDEFNREVERLTRTRDGSDREARQRLAELETEIGNLA